MKMPKENKTEEVVSESVEVADKKAFDETDLRCSESVAVIAGKLGVEVDLLNAWLENRATLLRNRGASAWLGSSHILDIIAHTINKDFKLEVE